MDEKTMVNDILSGVKASLSSYQTAISETENMQLRQALQQIRNPVILWAQSTGWILQFIQLLAVLIVSWQKRPVLL